MSRYTPGDILLVPFPFEGDTRAKLRPALVLMLGSRGDPVCCAIRSSRRAGVPLIPLGIEDFDSGGLDLFGESYVQTDTVRMIRTGAVAAKKGRVTRQFLALVRSQMQH